MRVRMTDGSPPLTPGVLMMPGQSIPRLWLTICTLSRARSIACEQTCDGKVFVNSGPVDTNTQAD